MSGNYLAPDGYRYGVQFSFDGSVSENYNGATQRERCIDEAARLRVLFCPDRIVPVRKRPGGEWRELTDGETTD